jgi:hypothetical protein
MMANSENTAKHWIWALLIKLPELVIVNQIVGQSWISAFNQRS